MTKPTLKLISNNSIQNDKGLFKRFFNPIPNKVELIFPEKEIRITKDNSTLNIQSLKEPEHYKQKFSQERGIGLRLFDPERCLDQLVDRNRITHIEGNCAIDEASVIFLDDTNHLDKKQNLIRGAIANKLRGAENIFLVEGVDETNYFLNEALKRKLLPKNLKIETTDFICGWDNGYMHKKSLETVRETFTEMLVNMETIQTFLPVVTKWAHERTKSIIDAIDKYRALYPNAKIFLFGGKGHFEETWLKEMLDDRKLSWVRITPNSINNNAPSLQEIKNYYAPKLS